MIDISQRLKRLRLNRGLTQADVAAEIHVSRPTYTEYELSKKRPSLETLVLIADFYNISLDYLVGRYDIFPDSIETELELSENK